MAALIAAPLLLDIWIYGEPCWLGSIALSARSGAQSGVGLIWMCRMGPIPASKGSAESTEGPSQCAQDQAGATWDPVWAGDT